MTQFLSPSAQPFPTPPLVSTPTQVENVASTRELLDPNLASMGSKETTPAAPLPSSSGSGLVLFIVVICILIGVGFLFAFSKGNPTQQQEGHNAESQVIHVAAPPPIQEPILPPQPLPPQVIRFVEPQHPAVTVEPAPPVEALPPPAPQQPIFPASLTTNPGRFSMAPGTNSRLCPGNSLFSSVPFYQH